MTAHAAQTPQAVRGPTVWSRADLFDRDLWSVAIEPDVRDELETTGSEDISSSATVACCEAASSLATLVRQRMFSGPGFVVVSGFPLFDSDAQTERTFAKFCRTVGGLLPQNVAGDLMDRVQDEALATVRGAKTSRALVYHTDFATSVPDAFALMAVRSAKSGGESLIASSHSVHNVLLDGAYDELVRLYDTFYFDRTGDVPLGEEAVLCTPVFQRSDGGLLTLYNRARIHRGYRQVGKQATARDVAALDALDRVLTEDRYSLDFTLEPGDVLFADNRVVLHNRKAFTEFGERSRSRLLLRTWMSCPESSELRRACPTETLA